ncbi:MAG: hypothetical protein NTW94_07260 [Legionellales bacterium]|nr:hypothetical protein [Legionellales bacterium]
MDEVVSGLCPIAAPYATWVGLGLGTIAAFRGGSDVLRQEFSPSKSMTTWRLTRGLPKLTACIVGTIGAVAAVPIGAACLILAGAFKLLGNLFHLTGSAKGAIPQSGDEPNDTMAPG